MTNWVLSARHIRNFKYARHMAEMSDFKKAKVGCVAVIGNKVIATGFSQHRTHPMQEHFNLYRDFNSQVNIISKLHAEMAMLSSNRHMGICWARADVYVYRICKSRQHGMSRPCKACLAALREMGVKNVFYSTDFGYAFEKIASITPRLKPGACKALFD